jgi:hypothetical protein
LRKTFAAWQILDGDLCCDSRNLRKRGGASPDDTWAQM